VSSHSENTFAALTSAIRLSASARRRVCSPSSRLGEAIASPIRSTPSSVGTSHVGPAVKRLGSANWRPIATISVPCTCHSGSAAGGGG